MERLQAGAEAVGVIVDDVATAGKGVRRGGGKILLSKQKVWKLTLSLFLRGVH